MEHSTFANRLGFLIWLRHLTDGSPPSYRDVGKAVGRSGEAVAAWLGMDTAPTNYRLHEPLARYFGATAKWIVDGEGESPQPELWELWVRCRTSAKRGLKVAELAFPKRRKGAG